MTEESNLEAPAEVGPRVLLFSDSDVFAGTEAHIAALAKSLKEIGSQVCVACPVPAPLADRARQAGIRVVPVAKRRMPDFAAIRILAAELRAGRVDIIHAHNGRTHLLAVAAVKRAGREAWWPRSIFLRPTAPAAAAPRPLWPTGCTAGRNTIRPRLWPFPMR